MLNALDLLEKKPISCASENSFLKQVS